MKQQLIAHQIADLKLLASQLLPIVKERKKVAFVGQIGAGKTTFIKLLCQELGVEGNTSSPTFSIINEYQAADDIVHHIDLYRLKSEEEAFSIGLIELFEEENSYCFIEWPDIVENYFPESAVWIRITTTENQARVFDIYYED